MVIDSHNHPDWHGHNLERFLQNMRNHGIDKTWLLTWDCPESEYSPSYHNVLPPAESDGGPIPFGRVLRYMERAPDSFVPGYAPDPRRPDAVDRLKAAVEIHGVKIYGELKLRMMYDNPDALRMYRACGELGLPVVVHIDYEFDTGVTYPRPNYWYGGGIEALERAVAACPDTVFLGHAPGFWAHISGDRKYDKEAYPEGTVAPGGKVVEMMRTYPNLHCDLSAGSGFTALNRDHEHARTFLTEFQDRILFGRDFFDSRLHDLLKSLSLPNEAMDKIMFGNSIRLTGD